MAQEINRAAEEEVRKDRRERFVLHGGVDDVPNCVPPRPRRDLDLEEVMRRLDDPERRRMRARRHSRL